MGEVIPKFRRLLLLLLLLELVLVLLELVLLELVLLLLQLLLVEVLLVDIGLWLGSRPLAWASALFHSVLAAAACQIALLPSPSRGTGSVW